MLPLDMSSAIHSKQPFSLLSDSQFNELLTDAQVVSFSPGERLLRPDELNNHVFYILEGIVRHLTPIPTSSGPSTIYKSSSESWL